MYDLAIPTADENILMLDTGCDQSVVCENSFHVLRRHSKFYRLFGALSGMESSTNLELVDA
jgi:hypothetical protein